MQRLEIASDGEVALTPLYKFVENRSGQAWKSYLERLSGRRTCLNRTEKLKAAGFM